MNISIESCVSALSSALISKRDALNLEMAVGLAIYCSDGAVNKQSKSALYQVYASAGYDCGTEGAEYNSVNRWINTWAALYVKITQDVIVEWVGRKANDKAIQAIAGELKKLEIYSVESAKAYAGLPTDGRRERAEYTPTEHPMRRANDVEYAFVIDTPHLHIGVPEAATAKELETAAKKLLALAEKMRGG